ncbi:unnamed protein product [Withania somnifera]
MFSHNLVVQHSPPILLQSKPRAMLVKVMSGYCTERPTSSKLEVKQVISGLAASILCLSQSNMAFAADLPHYNSVFPRANSTDSIPVLPLEKGNEGGGGKLMMMRGMTAKDFDPVRYSGRWFEVASLKRGFAGQGQEDCHCTQIYSRTPDPGPKFIEKYKNYLASFGYEPSEIKDTPQDCEVKSNSQLAAMMSMSGMQQALNNQFPDLELRAPVEFNPFTSVFDTVKKLVELYFKQ